MQGAINAESHEDMIARLDRQKRWGLSAAQRRSYAQFLAALPADVRAPLAYILENHHLDGPAVQTLRDKTWPNHSQAWIEVGVLARNIIRKNTYQPLNDHSLEEADLLQTALGEIAGGLKGFRHCCRLNTWIHQITLNSLRRGYRDRNAQRRKGATVALADTVAEAYNPLMEEARYRTLIEEIAGLLSEQGDPRLLSVFQLAIVEDRRLADIGQRLALSTTRTHGLLKRVRQVLCADPSLREHAREAGISLDDGAHEAAG